MSPVKKIYRTNKDRPAQPSAEDLITWRDAQADLIDHLYKGLPGYFHRRGHEIIHSWAATYKSLPVLEVGCGHGHHLEYGTHYSRYVGLDISLEHLKTARSRFGSKMWPVRGDALRLPFRRGSLDAIVSMYCLEHMKSLDRVLREIHRVLKPEGALLVGLPCEGGLLYNIGREFTSKKYMQQKYGLNYDAIVRYEHCNEIWDILAALRQSFFLRRTRYLPGPIAHYHLNAIACLHCVPR